MNFKSKKCKECGKIFIPKSGKQLYCESPHFTECKICKSIIEYTCSPKDKPTYCSTECRNEGKKQTVRNKYGVDNVSELEDVKAKIREANKSEEVIEKRKKTCIERYGVDNVSKHEDVKKKLSEVMKTDEYNKSRRQTCIEKYGFPSPMMTDEVKSKQRQTCLERYGMLGHPHTVKDYQGMMVDGTKVENYLRFKDNPKEFIETYYKEKPTISQLERDLGVTNTPIYSILNENHYSDLIEHNYSSMESEVYEFLISLDSDLNIVRNDRTVIKPLELDFYLPEYKIGIECNPASTHNSSIDFFGYAKHYKYHQMKSFRCEEQGVFLFHIFGYEWVNKREIIESMICNLLNKNKFSYGGRQTYVDNNVGYFECERFLNENHRQGHLSAKVRIGLRLKSTDELLSVMTFGHLRNTMGKSLSSTSDDWELSRFCTKLNTNVIGGASKLFHHFINEWNPKTVTSFSDIAHTKGGLYSKLGFYKVSTTSPSYVWCDIYDNRYFHRVACQKQYIKKSLNDSDIDLSKTESEIMGEHGYVRMYDSGVIKWFYHR